MIAPTLALESDALLPKTARSHVGRPLFTLDRLVADLELRVGAVPRRASQTLRIQRFAARMRALFDEAPYWASAFEADPWRAARELLNRRDALVLAGWNGEPFLDPQASARLRALAELELVLEPELPPGLWDRARGLERLLRERGLRPYDRLTLLEPMREFPGRIVRILDVLLGLGVRIDGPVAEALTPATDERTDLSKAQRIFAGARDVGRFVGDGTVRLLRAESPIEAAELAATELAQLEGSIALVAGPEVELLARALRARGLPTFGAQTSSQFRPLDQVLPLALRASTTPRDPHAVWQLLTLPGGPFDGPVGERLARALVATPAVGGPTWRSAREELAREGATLTRVTEWLELEGPERSASIPRTHVEAVARRVSDWLTTPRLPANDRASTARQAVAAFLEGVGALERDALSWSEVVALCDDVNAPSGRDATLDEAGRVDVCASPGGLHVEVDHVVWWGYVDPGAAGQDDGWTSAERRFLAARGVEVGTAADRMATLWRRDRRPFFASRRSILLVAPDVLAGESRAPHPSWDELCSLAGATSDRSRAPTRPTAPEAAPLPLPDCGTRVVLTTLSRGPSPPPPLSVTGLETALACPLRDVLERQLRLRSWPTSLSRGRRLYGTLAHRLLEVLHAEGCTTEPLDVLPTIAADRLSQLLRDEGQVLLSHADPFERDDAIERIASGIVELLAELRASGLEIEHVERPVEGSFGTPSQTLRGRLDLLLRDEGGRRLVVDLKWGSSIYAQLLREGRALQLMAYAALAREGGRDWPEVTFYSVSAKKLLRRTPVVDDWARVSGTFDALQARTRAGEVLIPAAPGSRTLADELGIEVARIPADAACATCRFDGVCGRRWRSA